MKRRTVLGYLAASAAAVGLGARLTTAAADTPQRFVDVYGANVAGDLTVDRSVLLDASVTVGGTLTVASTGSITHVPGAVSLLRVAGSVVNRGLIDLTDHTDTGSATLRILGNDETTMLGAPDGTPVTDRGVWAQDGGRYILDGSPRKRWTRAAAGLAAGQRTFTVADATGWRAGDELAMSPTEPASVAKHWQRYDRATVQSVSGNTVTLTTGLVYPHPAIIDPFSGAVWTPAVANLTTNVTVEGDTEWGTVGASITQGRSFVHFHDGAGVQTIRNAGFRHLGPRRRWMKNATLQVSEPFLGRYAVHFHRNGEASAGSLVEDSVIFDCGSRGFVPHGSHGITARGLVIHNVHDSALWWDLDDEVLDASLRVAVSDFLFSVVRTDPKGYGDSDISGVTFSWTGYGTDRASLRDGEVNGVQGITGSAGLIWPSQTNKAKNDVWVVERIFTHNNKVDGVRVWQNVATAHDAVDITAANNGNRGWLHGAYLNAYRVIRLHAFGNADGDVELKAAGRDSTTEPGHVQQWVDLRAGRVEVHEHKLSAQSVVTVTGAVGSLAIDESQQHEAQYDFVNTGLTPAAITATVMVAGSRVRVQTAGQAWQYDAGHLSGQPIPTFA